MSMMKRWTIVIDTPTPLTLQMCDDYEYRESGAWSGHWMPTGKVRVSHEGQHIGVFSPQMFRNEFVAAIIAAWSATVASA
jgi:NOL1/NOP2/fmu family ribosome biogenesis protein